jgi:hypothetical protein
MRTYVRDHNRLLSLVAQAIITQDPDLTDLTISRTDGGDDASSWPSASPQGSLGSGRRGLIPRRTNETGLPLGTATTW